MPIRIAVLASGSGSNLAALLDDLRAPDAPGAVMLVVTNRRDAGALTRAREASVPTLVLDSEGQDAKALLAALEQHRIQLVVLAGWLKLVPAAVVAAFAGRILNVHPALLPAFGGPGMYGGRVHAAVLASGARISGVTVHLVDEQYDQGAILAQWPVPVKTDDTAERLALRVLAAEHRLLPAVVRRACAAIAAGLPVRPIDMEAPHFAASNSSDPACDDALITA